MNAPIFSVVVCTYNRSNLLKQVMNTLISQTISTDEYELIIVDNNSTDNTKEVCYDIISNNPDIAIRYIVEKKQGISNARNRGWKVATGTFIAYTDDDCKIPNNWLSIAKKIVVEDNPGLFGGPYYAFFDSEKPKWFKDEYGSNFPYSNKKILINDESLNGANYLIKKSLIKEMGGFNPNLGMKGYQVSYGEEPDLIYRIHNRKPDELIIYYPELMVYHLVRKEKLSIRSCIKNSYLNGCSSPYIFSQHVNQEGFFWKMKSLIHGFGLSGYILLDIIIHFFIRNRRKYPYIQNFIYEEISKRIYTLGRIIESIKI